jgi:O-antigen/teichoic acid export membrane protein
VLGRRMDMRALSVLEIGSQLAAIVLMVGWAWLSPTAWALVAGAVVGSLVKLAASHLFLRGGHDRLRWERSCARELVSYGKWIFVSTMLTFFAAELDRLVFGKMIPIGELGVYSIATMIAGMPVQAILAVGSSIAFPAYSRVHREGGDVGRAFDRLRRPLVALGGVLLSGLVACGDQVVSVLYDARYAGAGWILRLLAVAGWFLVLECTNGALLLARGAPNLVALGNAGKIAGLAALMPAGFRWFGFPGAVAGVVQAEAIKYVVSAWSLARHHVAAWRRDLAFTLVFAASVAAGVLARLEVARFHSSPWMQLVVAGAALLVVWSPLLWSVAKGLRRDGS